MDNKGIFCYDDSLLLVSHLDLESLKRAFIALNE